MEQWRTRGTLPAATEEAPTTLGDGDGFKTLEALYSCEVRESSGDGDCGVL
jgi:hypothetical protein